MTPAIPAQTAKGTGNVTFAIDVPATSPQATGRKAQYVSPATKSIAVTVAGTTTNVNVVSGSPGCATSYTSPSLYETVVGGQPRGMVEGPDGNIWVVEDAGYTIGKIAPGGVYTDYYFGYFQNGMIVGPDGYLWTTSPFNALLGHISTAGAAGYFFGFPEDMQYIATAADSTVWGTSYTQGPPNQVYHISSTGTWLSSDTITTTGNTTMPTLGPDGAMYVTENNGTTGWVARIAKSGSTWSLTNEFPVPGFPYAITSGPDGALWVTDYGGHVYRMTTSGTITNTYQLTAGALVSIRTLSDGALWVAEYGANKVGRLTTSGAIWEYSIPTANTAVYDVVQGSDGVYFSEQNANKVGRLNFPVSCTATASLPAGTASATLTAYDAVGGASGGGHVLSTQTAMVTVTANTNNTVNFVLNGVVNSVTVTTAPIPSDCANSGNIPIVVQAQDAAGNAIIGPGNYSDANGNPLTINLTTNGNGVITNPAVTSPSSTPALTWSGSILDTQTLSATASGGTIPGTITPDPNVYNCT